GPCLPRGTLTSKARSPRLAVRYDTRVWPRALPGAFCFQALTKSKATLGHASSEPPRKGDNFCHSHIVGLTALSRKWRPGEAAPPGRRLKTAILQAFSWLA